MKHFIHVALLLVLTLCPIQAAPIELPMCRDSYSGRPVDYTKLSSKIRVCYGDNFRMHLGGLPAACSYPGLKIMVETYDVSNGEPVWSGRISYGPQNSAPNLLTPAGQDSVVTFEYMPHATYFDHDRTFGAWTDGTVYSDKALTAKGQNRVVKTPPSEHPWCFGGPDDALRVRCFQRFDGQTDIHHKMIRQAALEWDYTRPLSVHDIVHSLELLQKNGKYPPYSALGTTASGGYLNCVTFTLKFLSNFNISVERNASLAGHLREAEKGNWWRRVVNCIPVVGTLGAAVYDAAGGAAKPIKCLRYLYDSRAKITNSQGKPAKVVRWNSHKRNDPDNTILKECDLYARSLKEDACQDYTLSL